MRQVVLFARSRTMAALSVAALAVLVACGGGGSSPTDMSGPPDQVVLDSVNWMCTCSEMTDGAVQFRGHVEWYYRNSELQGPAIVRVLDDLPREVGRFDCNLSLGDGVCIGDVNLGPTLSYFYEPRLVVGSGGRSGMMLFSQHIKACEPAVCSASASTSGR